MYQSDSDEEVLDLAPNQVLPVANLPDSFDGVPQDGLEYLFTVRCFSCSFSPHLPIPFLSKASAATYKLEPWDLN
jgi:hypothetical protein